jgi:hypothetical protein
MSKRSAAFGVAVAFLAVAAIPASAREHAFSVNKTVKFPKGERVDLNLKAGPVTFTEVIIRNPPNSKDIKEAETKNPGDNCHPKIAVGVSNDGKEEMKFRVVVSFEDSEGNVYLKCDKDDSIDSGSDNDHSNLCWLDSMKTIDWPKLTQIRVVAEVDPDR